MPQPEPSSALAKLLDLMQQQRQASGEEQEVEALCSLITTVLRDHLRVVHKIPSAELREDLNKYIKLYYGFSLPENFNVVRLYRLLHWAIGELYIPACTSALAGTPMASEVTTPILELINTEAPDGK